MSHLVERLAELLRYLDHLQTLREKAESPEDLERDLTLRNDVLHSLLIVCQVVIDIAGELSARRKERFEDYSEAIRNLARDERFPSALVRELAPLPGFRNVLVHEYIAIDMSRVIEAIRRLEPIRAFAEIVRGIAGEETARDPGR